MPMTAVAVRAVPARLAPKSTGLPVSLDVFCLPQKVVRGGLKEVCDFLQGGNAWIASIGTVSHPAAYRHLAHSQPCGKVPLGHPLAGQQCLHDAELPCRHKAWHQLELEQVLLVELVDAGFGGLVFNFSSANVAVQLGVGEA